MSEPDTAQALELTELYGAVYLHFHRRWRKGELRLASAQWAVLQHLALTGPLTIGEAAHHLARAQSVVSEIVDGLQAKGLLARMRDARDRRRALVWLTERAHAQLARERQVLDVARLACAVARLSASERQGLIAGLHALVRAAGTSATSQAKGG